MTRVYLFLAGLIACAVVGAAIDRTTNHTHTATPLHVTAVFFDGVDHADYRQACAVWQTRAAWKCEAGLTVQLGEAAIGGEFGGYKVVAHSERMWRTGRIEYATVQVAYAPSGGRLTAHLRKRPGDPWLVWYVA